MFNFGVNHYGAMDPHNKKRSKEQKRRKLKRNSKGLLNTATHSPRTSNNNIALDGVRTMDEDHAVDATYTMDNDYAMDGIHATEDDDAMGDARVTDEAPTSDGVPSVDESRTIYVNQLSARLAELKQTLGELPPATLPTFIDDQRVYLNDVVNKFSDIAGHALCGSYAHAPHSRALFNSNTYLRIKSLADEINRAFSKTMIKKGHAIEFHGSDASSDSYQEEEGDAPKGAILNSGQEEDGNASMGSISSDQAEDSAALTGVISNSDQDSNTSMGVISESSSNSTDSVDERSRLYCVALSFEIPSDEARELGDMTLRHQYTEPSNESIIAKIENLRASGETTEDIVTHMFSIMASKWEDMALAHVSNVIHVVHHFIREALDHACHSDIVFENLWALITVEIKRRYMRAIDDTEIALGHELDDKATTDILKLYVMLGNYNKHAAGSAGTSGSTKAERIYGIMRSYYESRLVDLINKICAKVVNEGLLHAPDSPIKVFNLSAVAGTPNAVVSTIFVDHERRRLQDEIAQIEGELSTLQDSQAV